MQVSHVDLLHLVFNVSSIWSLRRVETLGTVQYLHCSLVFLLSTAAVRAALVIDHKNCQPAGMTQLAAQSMSALRGAVQVYLCLLHGIIHNLRREHFRHVVVVGYSGVVFAWMTLVASGGC